MTVTDPLSQFVLDTGWSSLPAAVRRSARRSLIDLVAVLAAGGRTQLSRAARETALALFGGDQASLAFDGRRLSIAGAALAHGMTLDAMDAHDGHRLAKGHAGAGIFPAALALAEVHGLAGQELLAALVVGYEVALRAAQALHRTAPIYHTSGAWVAVGAAAVAVRLNRLPAGLLAHALGIADYHSPRSPMMRCIERPSMLKDGAGWGSLTGLTAGQLAAAGFTGTPSPLTDSEETEDLWRDLGDRWHMLDTYFKPYVCCRWAQPAIHAAVTLQAEHALEAGDIRSIEVDTFEAASRLTVVRPQDTEQAQYSLAYSLAATLRSGRLDPEQVLPPFIHRQDVLRLADLVTARVDPELERQFPEKALARVQLELKDGRRLQSPVVSAPGDPHQPLSDRELHAKFRRYTEPSLGPERSRALLEACQTLEAEENLNIFLQLLVEPPQSQPDSLRAADLVG